MFFWRILIWRMKLKLKTKRPLCNVWTRFVKTGLSCQRKCAPSFRLIIVSSLACLETRKGSIWQGKKLCIKNQEFFDVGPLLRRKCNYNWKIQYFFSLISFKFLSCFVIYLFDDVGYSLKFFKIKTTSSIP